MLNLQRKEREVNFNAISEKQSIQLPRNMLLRSILIKISGTVDITVADEALVDEAPHSFLTNIELVGNGKEVIKSYSGINAYLLSKYDYGTPPEETNSIATVAGTPDSFEFFIPVNLADIGSKNKADTYLRTSDYSSLELRLTLGAATDMFTSTGGTFAFSALKAEITVREADGLEGNLGIAKEHTTQAELTATSSAFQIPLNVGNRIRRLFIKATDAGDPQNDIINNIKVFSGANVFVDEPGWSVRQKNKMDYGLENLEDGVYIVDFITDGHKTEALPTIGMNNLFVEFDATIGGGTTFIQVIPMELLF